MYEYIKYIKENGQVLYINSMHNNKSFNHIKEEIKQTNDKNTERSESYAR